MDEQKISDIKSNSDEYWIKADNSRGPEAYLSSEVFKLCEVNSELLEEIESLRSQLQQAEKERNHIKAARQATFTRLLKVTEVNTAMREDIWLLIDDYNSRINSADETTKEGKIRRGEYQSILDELIPILSRYPKEDTL